MCVLNMYVLNFFASLGAGMCMMRRAGGLLAGGIAAGSFEAAGLSQVQRAATHLKFLSLGLAVTCNRRGHPLPTAARCRCHPSCDPLPLLSPPRLSMRWLWAFPMSRSCL